MTNHGWRTAVQGDGAGFPDLIMLRDRLVVAELKAGKNKASADQEKWLQAFRDVGASVYLWWPEDWEEIRRVLG